MPCHIWFLFFNLHQVPLFAQFYLLHLVHILKLLKVYFFAFFWLNCCMLHTPITDHNEYGEAFFSLSIHGHNIPILFGIENYSIWATKIHFSLGGFQAVRFIEADSPQNANKNFLVANVKLTRQALSLIISKIGDMAMDLVGSVDTIKELWSRLHF